MNLNLMQFQLKAIKSLLIAMEKDGVRDIILKSPTGSGKTIMLTHFMDEYMKGNPNTVFVWLTPGKGSLEEQSKEKMDRYIHNAQTKLLSDVMASGFEENDSCFINWEKLTKKGNNALKDSEKTNFLEWIEKAFDNGLNFKVIIDESHQNFTEKADAIIQLFKTDKIIRCSATPIMDKGAEIIEIKEEEVIAEGLIKKLLVINEDFPNEVNTDSQTFYLLDHAIEKQQELKSEFFKLNKNINPLIVVQLPNNSNDLLSLVTEHLEAKGYSIESGTLAVWLADQHENLDNISVNDGKQSIVIIKQAVATGWDCPRAHILVKLRENMDETFEVQTIGRIRRMPEQMHYNNDLLDSCYLYTFDSKFTQGVKASLGKNALEAKTLFLKNEFKSIKLIKEQRTSVYTVKDYRKTLIAIAKYLKQNYSLSGDKKQNKIKLEACGYVFSDDIVRYTISGKIISLAELSDQDKLNAVALKEPLNTHIHGREYHNRVGRIGLEIGLEYNYINTIVGKLFSVKSEYYEKILNLEPRELYSFVINNFEILRRDVKDALAAELKQLSLEFKNVSKKEFWFPHTLTFTYDGNNKVQAVYSKNVYQGYLSSAEPRSNPEKMFEKYCEKSQNVDWFYKNGDKGDEYFSIVYYDNANNQKLFYPDYIISVKGKIWIIETKGGFTKYGESQDIDQFSSKKFELLKRYLEEYSLKGGFVRYDANSQELCIASNNYNPDINSSDWKLLDEVFSKGE